MIAYMGIDIGTTNSKALVVSETGKVEKVLKTDTPKRNISSIQYFDVAGIEKLADGFLESVQRKYSIRGVCYSSIGESVVPVAKGRALHDPLLWYESCTAVAPEVQKVIDLCCTRGVTGTERDLRLSLYKMLWMTRHLDLGSVEYWLPVSSYLAYRRTGVAVWDTSQACRSFLFNIHKRTWIPEVLESLGIRGQPGGVQYMGTAIGEADGITYGIGGHDHITGLFGIYALADTESVIYDSMGSAAVITALVEGVGPNVISADLSRSQGAFGAAFKDSQYYILEPFRYFGLFLSKLMELTGNNPSPEGFVLMNNKIMATPVLLPKAYFGIGGDLLLGAQKEGWNIINMESDIRPEELLQSAYVYLNVISRIMFEDIRLYCSGRIACFAGGAITKNDLFMKYRASIIEEEIKVLNTDEITAFGAAVSSIKAAAAEATLRQMRNSLPVERIISPDPVLAQKLRETFQRYEDLRSLRDFALLR